MRIIPQVILPARPWITRGVSQSLIGTVKFQVAAVIKGI
jgi:hypothetical protein